MRILKILYNIEGKGTYWRALGFAEELVARGHEVTLVATAKTSKRDFHCEIRNGVKVVLAPDILSGSLRSGWDPVSVLKRIAYFKTDRFDLIHAYESRPVVIYPALYIAKQQKIPLITDWCDWFGRGGSVEQRPNPIIRGILRPIETHFENYYRPQTAGITVINSILEHKSKALGFTPDQTHLLHNGVDPKVMYPQNKVAVRKKLNLNLEGTYIGYTGTIFKSDAKLLGEAFDRLHTKSPETRLLMIGYLNLDMRDFTRAKHHNAIIQTGQLPFDQLLQFVSACDIGCLPLVNHNANRGRFPLKLFDFMSHERPVVVTNTGDLGNIVSKHQAGFVIDDDTPESLANQLSELMSSPQKMRELGKNGRWAIENHYSWPIVTEGLERFYLSMTQQ
ncbi:MAG: glycosyltransferase involved in cell wall biosynthesis [Cellvibrionaceae bacterium]|jgi:glycosyltransferase involved in cell wall biosynthesis